MDTMKSLRTTFALSLIFLCTTTSIARPEDRPLAPRVDKRVELLCIAARLAGIKGFDDDLNKVYSREIDRHFGAYKSHPLIKLFRRMKPKLDDEYWEIPGVALHLGQPPKLEPLMAFDDTANVDGWESRDLFTADVVALVQQFYRDAKAEEFFAAQEPYYRSVAGAYEARGVRLNRAWVSEFVGLGATEDYFPIVGLGLRSGVYTRVNFADNRRHTITVYETTSFDGGGVPTTFTNDVYPRMMLHEYVHAFTNQLVDKHGAELRGSAETILKDPKVFEIVEKTFYGNWQYLLYESMVRACCLEYLRANGGFGADLETEIAKQEAAGFPWIRGLVKELDEYQANRARYRNLDEFMPRIVSFFKRTADEHAASAQRGAKS